MDLPPIAEDTRRDIIDALAARIDFAEHAATMTAGFLGPLFRSLGMQKPPALPAAFLLELGAILRIALLQRAQVPTAEREFPPASQLLEQLLGRLCHEPTSFGPPEQSVGRGLWRRALRIHLDECAWSGAEALGTEIQLSADRSDELLEAIADFLMQCAADNNED